jgi:tRNA(fMet)-specific endonuclease VapC
VSFLLDTDICSAYLKGDRQVWNRFVQHGGNLCISTVTLGELFAWGLRATAPPKRLQILLNLLKDVRVLLIDENVSHKFGEVRAGQLDCGLGTPDLDLFNGATALAHSSIMVTHNTADYANIPGLTVVDWVAP